MLLDQKHVYVYLLGKNSQRFFYTHLEGLSGSRGAKTASELCEFDQRCDMKCLALLFVLVSCSELFSASCYGIFAIVLANKR